MWTDSSGLLSPLTAGYSLSLPTSLGQVIAHPPATPWESLGLISLQLYRPPCEEHKGDNRQDSERRRGTDTVY